MQGPKHQSPYSRLGERLRRLRETRKETLAEVSGALEIDTEMLERFESGEECPPEDILTLLISYFALREHEASQLWEWAGFSKGDPKADMLNDLSSKAALVLVALDARVVYSDGMAVTASESGIVMNFLQPGLQSPNQAVPIARIGVSYEQAEQIIDSLQRAILHNRYASDTLLLPPGDMPQNS